MQALFLYKNNTLYKVLFCYPFVVHQIDDKWNDTDEESTEADRNGRPVERLDAVKRDADEEER